MGIVTPLHQLSSDRLLGFYRGQVDDNLVPVCYFCSEVAVPQLRPGWLNIATFPAKGHRHLALVHAHPDELGFIPLAINFTGDLNNLHNYPEVLRVNDASFVTTAVMDPKIFEKFIVYDSFFGNYMVKRYSDILQQSQEKPTNPHEALPGISDRDYSEYFDQMLLQVMDHSNDVRVQEYFNQLRDLPMDKVANDQTVTSPYLKENKRSVYEDFKLGKKARNDVDDLPVKVHAREDTTRALWEPRTIRRRYTVNNFPIYPSSNIHWVKRINQQTRPEYQVLNFAPPETLGMEVLSFLLTQSQGLQLFNSQVAGKYPTSQKSLDSYWEQHPTATVAL